MIGLLCEFLFLEAFRSDSPPNPCGPFLNLGVPGETWGSGVGRANGEGDALSLLLLGQSKLERVCDSLTAGS